MEIIKYPRTRHIAGSRLQKGDEDLEVVRVESLWGRHVVVEEKQDGANSAISFDSRPVPAAVIDRMIDKLEVPTIAEAHSLLLAIH